MKIQEITNPNKVWQSIANINVDADLIYIRETSETFIKAWNLIIQSPRLHAIHKQNLNNFIQKVDDFYKSLLKFPDQRDQDLINIKENILSVKENLLRLK
jgi:hypothetical protein